MPDGASLQWATKNKLDLLLRRLLLLSHFRFPKTSSATKPQFFFSFAKKIRLWIEASGPACCKIGNSWRKLFWDYFMAGIGSLLRFGLSSPKRRNESQKAGNMKKLAQNLRNILLLQCHPSTFLWNLLKKGKPFFLFVSIETEKNKFLLKNDNP